MWEPLTLTLRSTIRDPIARYAPGHFPLFSADKRDVLVYVVRGVVVSWCVAVVSVNCLAVLCGAMFFLVLCGVVLCCGVRCGLRAAVGWRSVVWCGVVWCGVVLCAIV